MPPSDQSAFRAEHSAASSVPASCQGAPAGANTSSGGRARKIGTMHPRRGRDAERCGLRVISDGEFRKWCGAMLLDASEASRKAAHTPRMSH